MKEIIVVFVASDKASEVLQPTDRAFDAPAVAVATELASILCGRLLPVFAMRADQIDSTATKTIAQRIAVRRSIIKQSSRSSSQNSFVEQRLDKRYFVRAGAGCVDAEWKTATVDEDHDLGPLAAFRLANLFTPFFAEANVPSAIDSSRSIRPCRSSLRSSRPHAFSQIPAWLHSWRRRQQVVAEGKCLGMSFQRAPLRRIQRMPSMQARGSTRGLPPSTEGGACGNRSAINCHCSFVSSYSGSILDPAAGTSVPWRDRSLIGEFLSNSPIRRKKPSCLLKS
jgi:hypothetical protein